jgi:hypothetical protein
MFLLICDGLLFFACICLTRRDEFSKIMGAIIGALTVVTVWLYLGGF